MDQIDRRRRRCKFAINYIQVSTLPESPFKEPEPETTPEPLPPEAIGKPKSKKPRRRPRSKPEPPPKTKEHPFSIFEISANAFHFNMKRKGNEFFTTSIYEVDRILQERYEEEDPDTTRLVAERLPKQYQYLKEVFSKRESNVLPPHRYYDHKIQLEAPLPDAYSPLYRQSTEELKVLREYLLENLDKGFIESSQSPFASPVLFVKKSDGGLRFCIDYRRLNALTRKDSYPIPRIDELLSRVSKAKVFTKLDIRAAFNRIRMDPNSEEYTTFRTRYGSYKCKVLPFGLCNGPGTYQRYMNDVLLDYLDDFCMAYLDDILIYSESLEEHEEHVKMVLRRLMEAGLQADIKKCEFHVTRTKYLGYIVTTEGIEADPEKVEPLRNWKYPRTVTATKSFLGFCGFYRQFIRNFGLIAKPLSTLTRPTIPWDWTEECRKAFEELRGQLLAIQKIYHFHPELPTKLETDASDGVIAGVVSQQHADSLWYPLGFYSHVLNGHEPNWEIHDKELYAIVESFHKWRPELMSIQNRLKVYSDHRSLEYFMTTKILTGKQARWMEFLSDFNFQIMYTPGKENQKADILSRREQDLESHEKEKLDSRSRVLLSPGRLDPRINEELANQFVAEIAILSPISPESSSESSEEEEPSLDPLRDSFDLIEKLCQDNRESFAEERKSLPKDYTDHDGLLCFKGRLCVQRNTPLCTRLIREAHDQPSTAHPNGKKTYQLLSLKYYWFGMGADCNRYVRNCRACQYSHPKQTKQQGFLHPLPIPAYPMQHLCVDYKDFPKDKHGFDRILVFIDRLSKSAVTIPCHQDIDARGTAKLFIRWIYRFGHTPESIISDRGAQFVSSFWKEFCRIIGVKVKLSTAYHKQTDGQTEIMNRYIDQRLRPFVTYYQDNWSELIPLIDRAQMTLPHESIGMAPYQLKFGMEPRNSWDWNTPKASTPLEKLNYRDAKALAERMKAAWELAKGNMQVAQDRMARATNQKRRPIDWEVGDEVYLSTKNLKNHRPSRKLANQWEGPFKVLEKVGHSYRLELPLGSQVNDVFAPELLSKDPKDPLPGQETPKPPPEVIEGQEEWEVEDILGVKLYRNTLKYQVKWLGHDPDPAWYAASDLMGSPHKLRDFHATYSNKPGPPRNLPEWLKAWESGIDDYSHLKDNRP
jgi:transposase InsO family protein